MGLSQRALHVFGVFWLCISCLAIGQGASKEWSNVSTPFRPLNVAAMGATIWVCGADEMIVGSTDGGLTWEVKHKNRDGEVLLNIAFVNDKIGHAAGTGGLLLSTADGGQTWKNHTLSATVHSFSFADAMNGIAIMSPLARPFSRDQSQSPPIVRITHDGGDHWEDVPTGDEALRPFSDIHSVVALDATHFLLALSQPQGENIFAFTRDAGKSWTPKHVEDVYASTAFSHMGEYWAFGMQILERKKHGGYSAPVVLHSKDGEAWKQGTRGPGEFSGCNTQGCNLWDGTIEELYGDREKFWALPQDGSLTERWAFAGNTVCTIGDFLKCAPAISTEKPQPRPERGGIIFQSVYSSSFSEGCLECKVWPILSDNPGANSVSRLIATVNVRRDGSVAKVSLDHASSQRMSDAITEQIAKWLFEPAHEKATTVESHRDVSLALLCSGWPGRPETARCSLHPSADLPAHATITTSTTTLKH